MKTRLFIAHNTQIELRKDCCRKVGK